jgi:hypothetical protein
MAVSEQQKRKMLEALIAQPQPQPQSVQAQQAPQEGQQGAQRGKTAGLVLVERLAPSWGVEAGRWIATQDRGMRTAAGLVGILMLIVGLFFLVGGGYTSIQGLRIPLALTLQRLGYTMDSESFPPIYWWLLPLANNIVQVFSKHIKGLKTMWRPTVLYDAITTAVYLSIGVSAFLVAFERPAHILIVCGVAALLSLIITVQAEKITFAALCVIRGATGRK